VFLCCDGWGLEPPRKRPDAHIWLWRFVLTTVAIFDDGLRPLPRGMTRNYPICLQSYGLGGSYNIDCSYTSMAQCQADGLGPIRHVRCPIRIMRMRKRREGPNFSAASSRLLGPARPELLMQRRETAGPA